MRLGETKVLDSLIASLVKFTKLNSKTNELPDAVSIGFGTDAKAHLAVKTLFKLVTSHGDVIDQGWTSIIALFLQLFRCRLLPEELMSSEDFVAPGGRVSLVHDAPVSRDTGILSSLYSYIALGDNKVSESGFGGCVNASGF